MSELHTPATPDWLLSLLVPLHGHQPQPGVQALATALARATWRKLQAACEAAGATGAHGQEAPDTPLAVALNNLGLHDWPASARWWSPELGSCMARLSRGQLREATIFFLLAAHGTGATGDWTLDLPQPCRLSFAGATFTAHEAVKARCEQGRLQLWVLPPPAAPLCWQHIGAHWVLEPGQATDSRIDFAAGATVTSAGFEDKQVQSWTLPASYRSGDDPEVDWPPAQTAADLGPAWRDQAARQTGEALDLLGQLHGNYRPWCQPLLRGLAACRVPHAQMLVSGSYRSHAGMLTVGFPIQTPLLAETLVHEISHQYYSLLSYAVPLIDRQVASGLYYSSFKRKDRPLEKILFAFHATANMAFYWHGLLQMSGPWQDLADRELGKLVGYIDSLGQTLREAPGLSPTGLACFELQSSMLQARGLRAAALAEH
ncbi:hypothetical protein H5407_05550 [Mitsuaria sp. WAJ17]|uniref:aKG-HExxH-type peptide beta-hydroxylase n=1 Tax=Mitsuaria sp. WAJ17 TaxID=2761452 RepID=UPI001603147D|nr:HEXXH motif-containing putative peptide modification protein [Mitsuaria sp. WAJ17]MBB2484687.1 hypothetical protein [Mitsuaria sp. WAJ17]